MINVQRWPALIQLIHPLHPTLTFHSRKQAHIVRWKDASLSNTTHVEHDLTSVTEEHVVRVDATTDAMVGMVHTAGKLKSTRNETVR